MRCITCGAKTISDETTDVTDLKKCLLIVRNVPCHKCVECNETMLTGDVVKWLEDTIHKVKESMNEVTIINYSNKVA